MQDTDYLAKMQEATHTEDFEHACQLLAELHVECDNRGFQASFGHRSSSSVHSKQFVSTVNAVREKFGKFVVYCRDGFYREHRYGM